MGALSAAVLIAEVSELGHLRAFYARLVASGKLKKVALVAVMRKRLIHLNATMRTAADAAAPAAPET